MVDDDLTLLKGPRTSAAESDPELKKKPLFNGAKYQASFCRKVIESGPVDLDTSLEEKKALVDKRREALHKKIGMTDTDYDLEMAYIKKDWQRCFTLYYTKSGLQRSQHRWRHALMAKNFIKENFVFKPLGMKLPKKFKYFNRKLGYSSEKWSYELDSDTILNAERLAGFTYEDWVDEYKTLDENNCFTGVPEVGELVNGKVVFFSQEDKASAFVELTPKPGFPPYRTWAWLPLKNITVETITSARDYLEIGQEIEATVVAITQKCRTPGDQTSRQAVLSMRELAMGDAIEELQAAARGDRVGGAVFIVTVLSMQPWGAVVRTERGIYGAIMTEELGNRKGDLSLMGSKIQAEFMKFRFEPEKLQNAGPNPPRLMDEVGVRFTYKNIANKELAARLEKYQLLDAVVREIQPGLVLLEVQGLMCDLKKVDVSNAMTPFELIDVFEVGETIKCMVVSLAVETGDIRLSTRILEVVPGAMLTGKAKVMKMAEAVAPIVKKAMIQEEQDQVAKFQKLTGSEEDSDTEGNMPSADPDEIRKMSSAKARSKQSVDSDEIDNF